MSFSGCSMTQRNPLLVLVGADYVGPFPPAVKSYLSFRSPVASTPGLYAFCTITAFLHESCPSSLTPVCQDCTSRSRFGMQGSKPLHCKDHRQPGLFPWPCDSQILSWIGSPLTILQFNHLRYWKYSIRLQSISFWSIPTLYPHPRPFRWCGRPGCQSWSTYAAI